MSAICAPLPELPEFVARFRAWLAANADALAPYHRDVPGSYEDLIRRGERLLALLYDAGWARCGWPELISGFGGDPRYRCALWAELWAAGYVPPEQHVTLEVMLEPMIHFNPALAAEMLPAVLRGDRYIAQGFSEPEAGSDLAALRCRATRDGNGPDADYLVNGQKIWTSNGMLADDCMLLVRTGTPESRHRGLSMMVASLTDPGVTRRPVTMSTGHDELSEVFYDDVRVPVSHRLGAEGEGWAVAMYLLQFERGLYPWLRAARMYYRITRLQEDLRAAGVTGPDAARRLGLAKITVDALQARAATTARRLASGETIGPDSSADKILLSTTEQLVLDTARDLLGPAFLFDDSEAAADWRHEWLYSRATSVYGGAGEVQRTIAADHVLHLPKA